MSYNRSRLANRFAKLSGTRGKFSRSSYAAALVTAQIQNKQFDLPGNYQLTPFSSNTGPVAINQLFTSFAGYTAGGLQTSLNLVPQGSASNQREGRQIIVTGIEYHLKVYTQNDIGSQQQGDVVRLVLLLQKQTNGTAATAADIWQIVNANNTDILSHPNVSTMQKYKILDDRIIELNPQGSIWTPTDTGGAGADIDGPVWPSKNVRLKMRCNIPIEFNATVPPPQTAPLIINVMTNNLVLTACSAAASYGQNTYIVGTVRLLYVG